MTIPPPPRFRPPSPPINSATNNVENDYESLSRSGSGRQFSSTNSTANTTGRYPVSTVTTSTISYVMDEGIRENLTSGDISDSASYSSYVADVGVEEYLKKGNIS